jgi:hypothetical protein
MSTAIDFSSLIRKAKGKKAAGAVVATPLPTPVAPLGEERIDISRYKIGSIPSVYYIPDFLKTTEAEQSIIQSVRSSVQLQLLFGHNLTMILLRYITSRQSG